MEEIRGGALNADTIRFAIQGNRPIGAKELSAMKSIYEVARRLGAAIGGKSRPIQILIVDDEVRFLKTIAQRLSIES